MASFQSGGTSPRSHEMLISFKSSVLVSLGNCLSISYVIVSARSWGGIAFRIEGSV